MLLWGVALVGAAVLLLVLLETSAPMGIVAEVLALGVVFIGVVAWFRADDGLARLSSPARAAVRVAAVALLLVAVAAVAMVLLAGSHSRAVERSCDEATSGQATPEQRARAYDQSVRLRTGSWHALARRIDDDFELSCAHAEDERAREQDGRCPRGRAADRPCRCGGTRWPEEFECDERPRCVEVEGEERLECPEPEPRPSRDDLDRQMRELREQSRALGVDMPSPPPRR